MRYLLLHTSAWDATSVGPALERAQIEARQARLPRDLAVDERPTVFLLDSESRSTFPLDVLRAFIDAGGAIVALGRNREIGELTRIGVALGTERDVKSLLDLILTQARRITSSDAGSLYLVEPAI